MRSEKGLDTTDTGNPMHIFVPLASPGSMREACARAMLDRGGQCCPAYPVCELCQSEVRWIVKAPPRH